MQAFTSHKDLSACNQFFYRQDFLKLDEHCNHLPPFPHLTPLCIFIWEQIQDINISMVAAVSRMGLLVNSLKCFRKRHFIVGRIYCLPV